MPFWYNVGGRIVEIEPKGPLPKKVPKTLFGFPVIQVKSCKSRKLSITKHKRMALEE